MRQRGIRLSLLGRFSLLSLLALAALGVVVGTVLASRIESRAVSDATRLAVVMARTGAASALTPADLRGPVGARRAAELDRTLKRPLTGNGAAIVKVYNADGTVVYAGNHEQIGERERDEVTEPLKGSVVHELARGTHDDGKGERMLSVYVPLSVAGGRPDGVFELYLPYAPVGAAIARDTRILALLLVAGLLLVWLGLSGSSPARPAGCAARPARTTSRNCPTAPSCTPTAHARCVRRPARTGSSPCC